MSRTKQVARPTQNTLSALSNEQLNIKLAKFIGWKLVNEKWWHDDIGDGPPMDGCKVFGRELVERILSGTGGGPLTPLLSQNPSCPPRSTT